jgi:hypothetical protein
MGGQTVTLHPQNGLASFSHHLFGSRRFTAAELAGEDSIEVDSREIDAHERRLRGLGHA